MSTSQRTSVIVAGARTPIGRLLGSLKGFSATDLGGIAIRAALERSSVAPDTIGHVIMGHVIQAGAGQITARQAAAKGGIPMTVPALTINKVCLSGLTAIALADQFVRVGESEVVVAGGMESMTRAPHLLLSSRQGTKYGSVPLVDSMAHDALTCAFDGVSMGIAVDRESRDFPFITRERQDEFAARSHRLAVKAQQQGRLAEEIVPVVLHEPRGEERILLQDEGVRGDTTEEALAALPPAFLPDGSITAGSSSQISDGASAVLVMSKGRAQDLGVEWIAEIEAYGSVSGPGTTQHGQPANAARRALERVGLAPADVDLWEINEAFAAVVLASGQQLDVPLDRINVNGGAIAVGHPVGMSGSRLVLTLAMELRRRGGGLGVATLCGGGGQGDALVLRVPESSNHQKG